MLLLLLAGYRLGGAPLSDPDEGRNAEVAREMAASGDFLVPHLNGLPYLDKPLLFFAASGLAMSLLGPGELAARLPSLLFGLATALLVGAFATRLWSREAGWVAALAAFASPLALAFSRIAIMDSATAFFIVAALLAFHQAIESAAGTFPATPRRRLAWSLLAWLAMGFGILAKGPVALLLPLLVAAPYAAWRRASGAVWQPLGPLVMLAVVAPWVAVMERQVPGFLRYVFVTETWQRVTTGELKRTGPPWYYLPYLVGGTFPWIVALAAALRRDVLATARRRLHPHRVFLALWLVLPLIFFSLSQSKRPQYILPLVPAVALALAGLWAGDDRERPRGLRAAAGALGGVGLLLAALAVAFQPPRRMDPELAALVPATAVGLGVVLLLAAALAWGLRQPRWAAAALALPVAALPALAAPILDEIGRERSTATLAAAIDPHLDATARVIAVEAYPPSLPFYLRRTILLASAGGDKLTSNYLARSYDAWVGQPGSTLRPAGWWREALATCRPAAIFVIRGEDMAARLGLEAAGVPLLLADRRYAAYGPCAPPTVRPTPPRPPGGP